MIQTYDPILPLRRVNLHITPSLLLFSYRTVYLNASAKMQQDLSESPALKKLFLHFPASSILARPRVGRRFSSEKPTSSSHSTKTKKRIIGGASCIVVEPDIDYYKDLAAHTLLEVIPNASTGGLTNPQEVYVWRWIAGRRAGVAEFNPPYTIVK